MLVTVPQHPWLWSKADDYAHHVRRYTRRELGSKLEKAGFELRHVTSFVSLLLPAMGLSRVRERRSGGAYDPVAEHKQSERIRRPLAAVMSVERALIERGLSLPAGGSLLAVAQRR